MSEDLIISIDKMRYYANISDTTDANFLAPLIIQATDTIGESTLGTALVERLRSDYNNDTLAGIYSTLYVMVEKMIIWQSYSLGLPRMLYRIGNGQITKGTSSGNSDPIDSADLSNLQRGAAATLATYENKVKTFLQSNYSSFPELKDNTPDYVKANLSPSDTSQGTTYTPNIYFSDF